MYEYFLSQFASQEGRKGGEFYTPRSVVRVLVEMLAPYKGRVFDPCCGSGGMFVQSEKFVEAHGGKIGDLSVYGQESNPNTFKLAKMNLAIRGIEGDLGKVPEDSFHHDQHPDLKADYILANPPFNMSDWGGDSLREDKRWKYGKPPVNNANFAWVQHFIHHLESQWHGRICAGERQHVEQYIGRRRHPQSHHRRRSGGLHGRPAWSVVLQHRNPCVFVVPYS